MSSFIKFSRAAVLLFVCAFLAACTQTASGVSSYNGSIGSSKLSSEKKQKAKRLVLRKRAIAKRAAERKKFFANRKASRKNKLSRSKKPKTKLSVRKKTRKHLKKKRLSKRSKHRSRKVALLKKKKHKRSSKSKSRRIKKSTYAYVGGRSKGIKRSSSLRCVPRKLRRVISQISRKYGRVTINSTHRSRRYNRRVGGKRRSYHLRCRAVDFRVHGRTRGLTRWLSRHPLVGGYKRYRSGFYHIDNGPRRTW